MCMSLPISLPGLQSGLDSLRFSTIAYAKLTFHCRLNSTAHSVTIHSGQRPNAALCCAMRSGLCYAVRSGPVLDPPGFEFGSEHFTNQVKTHHRRYHLPPSLPRPRRWRRFWPRVPPRRRQRVPCAQVVGPRGTTPRACA